MCAYVHEGSIACGCVVMTVRCCSSMENRLVPQPCPRRFRDGFLAIASQYSLLWALEAKGLVTLTYVRDSCETDISSYARKCMPALKFLL